MKPFTQSEQYELWRDLSIQNRHLRRNTWFHWLAHLILVIALGLLVTRPLIAVRVDGLGNAELVANVAASNAPGPEEAEAVTRQVAIQLLEVSAGSVARDIARATQLMTADFARAYLAKVKDEPALAALEKGNLRTQLTVDPQATLVKAEKDATGRPVRYHVQLQGRLDAYRADTYTAPLLTRVVTVRATLKVVPRTRSTLNGLLVSWFEREFEDRSAATAPSTSPLPTATNATR